MEIDVFISYHTASSKNIVEAVVNKLESVGIRCWYAPRDVEGVYAESIMTAIEACRIFLLVLNKEASESKHVLNELEEATERFGQNIEHIIPFKISDDEISKGAQYYIKRIHWIDATTPEMEDRIGELATKISGLLGKKQEIKTEAATGAMSYALQKDSIYADNNFKGREEELDIIHRNLTSGKNKFFLVGMGGCGKSELARKYCESHAKDYDNIVWISYSQSLKETFINDNLVNIVGLSRNEHLDKSAEEYFEYKLNVLKSIADEKTLLVIDNFDVTKDEQLDNLCSGKYAVLFTTRYRDISNRFGQLLLDEMKLNEEEQLELFCEIHKRRISEDKLDAVKEILNILDGHVLSIRIVATTMASNRMESCEMLEILKGSSATGKVYDRLREMMRLSNLSDDEMYLLKNLSLVSLQGIETRRFVEWCGVEGFDVIDSLVQKSWVILDEDADVIHLHPIISDLAFEELSKDFGACEKFLENLINSKMGAEETYSYKQWLMGLISYIEEKLPNNMCVYNELLLKKARLLHHLSLFVPATALYENLLEKFKIREKLIFIYRELSHLKCMCGYFEESLSIAKECISRFFSLPIEELPNDEKYIYKGLITRFAESYRNIRKYDEAIIEAERALEISSKYLGKGYYSSVAWGKYHLARALYMRGLEEDIVRGERLLCEATEDADRENDYWTKNYCVEFLSQILMKRNKFEEAIKNTELSYKSLVNNYGQCSIDPAINRVFMANIYRTMGNEEEAVKYYTEAIEVFRKCGTHKLAEHAEDILNSGKIGYVS